MTVGSYYTHRGKLAILLWPLQKFIQLGLLGALRFIWWEIIKRFHVSTFTVSTKQGIFTITTKDEIISRSLYCRREYELEFSAKAMELLRNLKICPPKGKGSIVDIGANNGAISIGMLHTKELEKAIAIEPEPNNFNLLVKNIKQNDFLDKFVCLPYAISNQKGEVLLELSERDFGDHRVRPKPSADTPSELFKESKRNVIKVESDTLDQLLETVPDTFRADISVVWVDVQGYEGYVFLGAKQLLSTGIPVVSEIWPYGLKRAGVSAERFCQIAEDVWSNYWLLQEGKFIKYPVSALIQIFDEINYNENFNVVFTA